MKNYTPALVNSGKPKFSLKTFLLGSAAARSYYFCARHNTDDMYILWIETTRFGNSFCFPCVLDEQGDAMVYITGRGMKLKADNMRMIQRWNLFMKPATFAQEFHYHALTPQEFHDEYRRYKDAAMGLVPEESAPAESAAAPPSLPQGETGADSDNAADSGDAPDSGDAT